MTLIYDEDFLAFVLIRDRIVLFEGGRLQLFKYIQENKTIETDDFFFALNEMDKNKHNVSEFGIFGGFLFTKAG